MIDEGEDAPTFELPAVRDGEIEQVALSTYLDDQVVILAFYPGDFNPECDGSTTGLDDLDLFTMQKDVSVLALSGDSVYSHRAFAEEYSLHIPLLSDPHGEVASAYGVAVEDDSAGHLARRAVVVIDHRGTVEYTWQTDAVAGTPDVDAIRTAVQNVGDDDSAFARYRVGHAHYMEGRRAFTSAMKAYDSKEWMMATGDFDSAFEEFSEAEDEFNTAARFAQEETNQTYYERAERKAESLWRAAEWLGDSASAYASGEGGKAQSLREDAENPLENARDVHEPVSPDEFPPDEDPAETDDQTAGLGGSTADVSLSVDFDTEEDETEAADSGERIEFGIEDTPDEETTPDADSESEQTDTGEEIADEELEEIAAELEQQTAQTEEPDETDDDSVVPSSLDIEETGEEQPPDSIDAETTDTEQPDAEATDTEQADGDGEIELDLTDPTEDEDDDEDEEDMSTGGLGGNGDHGVPDSL